MKENKRISKSKKKKQIDEINAHPFSFDFDAFRHGFCNRHHSSYFVCISIDLFNKARIAREITKNENNKKK